MLETLKKYKIQFISWLGIVIIIYMMTLLHVPMVVKNIFLVVSTFYCFFLLWKDNSKVKWELAVILLGLLARIIFCYLDVYTEFQLPISSENDGIAFMEVATEYYYGDFHRVYTKYPYVLFAIFKIAGINQFAAQYVNIMCWCLIMILFQKVCRRLDISGGLRLVAIAIMSWLPTNIWITSVLLRDTYIMLFVFVSFYYLLCWMQEGKGRVIMFSIGTIAVASWFHGGSIIGIIPIMLVLIFYSRNEKKFVIKKQCIFVVLATFFVGMLLYHIPKVYDILWNQILAKMSFLQDGIINGVNYWLKIKYDYSFGAGSNYMEGRYLTGYFDILVMTVQKIYYHMFSPVPHMWRGIVDAIAFVMSSAPIYLITTVMWFVSMFYKKFDNMRFVMFMEAFVTIGVYAWGNVNAGAALRHREKIIGVMILLMMYSLQIIRNKRKEEKSNE